MIERYADEEQTELWSDEGKLENWQRVEIAVIQARENLELLPSGTAATIRVTLERAPFDISRWHALERELAHDLNAFVYERQEKLVLELRRHFHDRITSYDTEEPAFAMMLLSASRLVLERAYSLEEGLKKLALRYRYTIMNARTHGQEAELQSFGKRVLTWLVEFRLGVKYLQDRMVDLRFSKLSGAIGNNASVEPAIEIETLRLLGLKSFSGATQIMPRTIYVPVAQALCTIVQVIDKISTDIRLMARSGLPLVQEPFKKKQTGSSAMPHKKNTISTEKEEGMARMALGYLHMIELNLKTWEERAIEQSSVERVAWPDLFHVTTHAIVTLTKVLSGLNVYPDNMLREVVNCCGCYATAQAKDFLKEKGERVGITSEEAYRIVQLAGFNVLEPDEYAQVLRDHPLQSLAGADEELDGFSDMVYKDPVSIREHIKAGELRVSAALAATEKDVARWNEALLKLFKDSVVHDEWLEIFKPSYLLRHEYNLYKEILGVEFV